MANLGGVFSGGFARGASVAQAKQQMQEQKAAAKKQAYLDSITSTIDSYGTEIKRGITELNQWHLAQGTDTKQRLMDNGKLIQGSKDAFLPQIRKAIETGVQSGVFSGTEATALLAKAENALSPVNEDFNKELIKYRDKQNELAAEISPENIEGQAALVGEKEKAKQTADKETEIAYANQLAQLDIEKQRSMELMRTSPEMTQRKADQEGAVAGAKKTAEQEAERKQTMDDLAELAGLISEPNESLSLQQHLRLKQLNDKYQEDPKRSLATLKSEIAHKIQRGGMEALSDGEKRLVPLLIDPFSLMLGAAGMNLVGGQAQFTPEQTKDFESAKRALETKDEGAVIALMKDRHPQMSESDIRRGLGLE